MGGDGRVQVIDHKGCSRLFVGFTSSMPSFRGLQSFEPMSTVTPSVGSESVVQSNGPFAGLVVCVTGLSKEARQQVREATERLGGQYSPNLHPQCTHLVVQLTEISGFRKLYSHYGCVNLQRSRMTTCYTVSLEGVDQGRKRILDTDYSYSGRKFEHALKHGSKNGLYVVTLGWFVDSVRRNVRLSESLYSVKNVEEGGVHLSELNRVIGFTGSENSCLPAGISDAKQFHRREGQQKYTTGIVSSKNADLNLFSNFIYIDSEISHDLRKKVHEAATSEGATVLDRWFVGCAAGYVVCEGASAQKYLGHSNSLVTPAWVLKTAREKHVQRLVNMSADLARQIGVMLENFQTDNAGKEIDREKNPQDAQTFASKANHELRQQIVNSAKIGVRNRRGRRMQTCQTPIRPITPSSLMDSICWSICEPTSTASIYTDTFSDGVSEHQTSVFFDANGDKDLEAPFANLTRPLTESEKTELVFKNHFLTILFPIDRFSEMGPSSRTFFCENGFTCLQVLDYIYAFYQEIMSASEVEAAIYTDSRHADRLRTVYASKETSELGYVIFKRIDFLGSRKSFEMLKRVNGDNNSNVYELLIRA